MLWTILILITPYCLGLPWRKNGGAIDRGASLFFTYVTGYFLRLALFHLICLPIVLMRGRFSIVCNLFSLSLLLFSIIGVYLGRKNFRTEAVSLRKWLKSHTVYELIYFIGFLLIFFFQANQIIHRAARNHIQFRTIDKTGLLLTPTLAFSANEVSWNDEKSRSEMLANCSEASIFHQKSTYSVVPQDFAVKQSTSEYEEIGRIFSHLCRVLSYVYMANTANIVGKCVVLQFDLRKPGEVYAFNELENNPIIYRIYEWIYEGVNCVDKAGIARGIINIYCNTKDDILNIGETVLSSIISDYGIYQKNHVEAYIEMKNKISEFILDTGKQIQELTGDLTDGLKNNVLAVIGFGLTVVLTDSIDLKEWVANEVSPRVIAICGLFVIGSICSLAITIISNNSKWNWIEKSYDNLKENYVKTLDDADIQETFGNDKIKDDAHKQYRKMRCIVLIIWIVIILAMSDFTVLLSVPLQRFQTQENCEESRLVEDNKEITESSEAETTEDVNQTEEGMHNEDNT